MPKHNRIPYTKAQRKWEPQLSSAYQNRLSHQQFPCCAVFCGPVPGPGTVDKAPLVAPTNLQTESTARCAPLPAGCCAKLSLMRHRAFTQRTKSFSGCLSEFPFSFQNVVDDAKSSIASRKQQNIKKRKEEEIQILKQKKNTHTQT